MEEPDYLKGKVAIVTGSSRGIGAAIVERLVSAGCKVAFTYNKSKDKAFGLEKKYAGNAAAFCVDVRNFEKMKLFVKEVKEKFHRLDILINNAGIMRNKPLMMMVHDDWHDIIDTNLNGTYNATRSCVVGFMKQKSGTIVNISSVAGLTGIAGQANYSASKAGIIGFTKALAKELGPFGVRVNAVAPGFIESDMLKEAKKKEEFLKWVPIGRFGNTDEVADTVLFLLGDKARYITGQTIRVDGGLAI